MLVDLILVEDEVSVDVVCQDPEDVGGEWVVDNGSDLEPEGEASDGVSDGEGCDDRGDDSGSDCDCRHSVMEDSEQDEGTVSPSEDEAMVSGQDDNGDDDSNDDGDDDSNDEDGDDGGDDDSNNDSNNDTTYVEYYDYYRNVAVIDGNFQLRPRVPVEVDDVEVDA